MDLTMYDWVCLGVALCGFALYVCGKARRDDNLARAGSQLGLLGVTALPSPVTGLLLVVGMAWGWVTRP